MPTDCDCNVCAVFVQKLLDLCKQVHTNVKRTKSSNTSSTVLDLVTQMTGNIFIGHTANDIHERRAVSTHLAAYFRRQPQMLIHIIQTVVQNDPSMRRVLTHSLYDVHRIENSMRQQNVQLKYGGRVSCHRWKQIFSQILQETVEKSDHVSMHSMIAKEHYSMCAMYSSNHSKACLRRRPVINLCEPNFANNAVALKWAECMQTLCGIMRNIRNSQPEDSVCCKVCCGKCRRQIPDKQ